MNTSNITNYKPKDFVNLIGVLVKTLQRWNRDNILKSYRTPTDRRYYTYEQYLKFKGSMNNEDNEELSPHEELVQDIIYLMFLVVDYMA